MTTLELSQISLIPGKQEAPITLPPLFCPFPAALNPQVEAAHNQALTWAVTFQLVQPQSKQLARLGAARLAWFAAHANPDFSLDQLALFTEWLTWLVCYDDLCDADALGRDPEAWGMLCRRLMAIVQGARQPDPAEPLACALADLCQRLRQHTPARWLDRFAYDVKQAFQANRWEAAMRASGAPPDLATYTKMWQLTSAVAPCFDLVAICTGLDPHAPWLDHAYLQQMEMLASNHVCWVNDLFGLAKEIKENNQNNLVLVLQHEFQLSLQTAVDRAVALCNAEMNAFLALADLFSTEEEGMMADCRRYINSLQTWMRGNVDWYAQTGRYQAQPLVREATKAPASAQHAIKPQATIASSKASTATPENPAYLPGAWSYGTLREELLALS